jgi:hypothetical protein
MLIPRQRAVFNLERKQHQHKTKNQTSSIMPTKGVHWYKKPKKPPSSWTDPDIMEMLKLTPNDLNKVKAAIQRGLSSYDVGSRQWDIWRVAFNRKHFSYSKAEQQAMQHAVD